MVQLNDRDADAARRILFVVAGFIDAIEDDESHNSEILHRNCGWLYNRLLEFGSPGVVGSTEAPAVRKETAAWLRSVVATIDEQRKTPLLDIK
jgi:hypothetical protein